MSGTGDNERAQDEADRAAWQSIVDNFGDRVELDDPPPAAAAPMPTPVPSPVFHPADDEDRFVPPPPPPLPRPEPRRAAAWAGLVLAPVLSLLAMVLSFDLAPILDFMLIAWFVGGFGYLVATMSSTPRDPWDDGSRV